MNDYNKGLYDEYADQILDMMSGTSGGGSIDKGLIDSREVERMFDISKGSINLWQRYENFPEVANAPYHLQGQIKKFRLQDVNRWIEKQSQSETTREYRKQIRQRALKKVKRIPYCSQKQLRKYKVFLRFKSLKDLLKVDDFTVFTLIDKYGFPYPIKLSLYNWFLIRNKKILTKYK